MQRSRAVIARLPTTRRCMRPISSSCRRRSRASPTPEEYSVMTEFTEQLVDTAALRHPPEGWIAPTPGPRSDEKRLARKIETVSTKSRAPSTEKTEFEMWSEAQSVGVGDWLDGDDQATESFAPGTFVELRRNEQATHGVVLGEVMKDSRMHVITLVSSGEVWDPLREDVLFAVPALAPPDLARRCSILEIAVDEIQRNARVKVLQRIRQLERAVEAETVSLNRSNVNIYSVVKSRDPDAWAVTTVAEVARLFATKPSLVTIFAAHKYLMDRPEQFVASHGYIFSQAFDVRPSSHIQTMHTVSQWCRDSAGPVQDFAKRAMPVMAASRERYSQSHDETPSQTPADHVWTPEDESIIKFLHHSLQPMRSTQSDPYSIGQSAILRALDPTRRVDDHEVHMTLVDLGFYAPWQDIYSLRRNLNLDQEDPKTSATAKATEALVKRSLSAPPKTGPLGPEDFYPSDPLDHLRHDFGTMPVYVIDDPRAEELDDGISVEAVAGEPDSYWIHVHIADPASTLPPTHILAQRAAKQSETAYFLHRTIPLFPKSLMFSGLRGFSLTSQTEDCVLTFSSKINAEGALVESVIRPGIARNFVKLSYDEVDMVTNGKLLPRTHLFNIPPPTPATPQLPEQYSENLRTLSMLNRRVQQYRIKRGVIEANNESIRIEGFDAPDIDSPTMQPSAFRGFPRMLFTVHNVNVEATSARGMVSECMKLACRTASRWCLERGVDVPRRGATSLQASPGALEKLQAMRDEDGYVDVASIAALAETLPVAAYSTQPIGHWQVGAAEGEGYTRTTSPLRRYSDLLVHYQIHRALLGEKPFYTATYLNEYLRWLKHADQFKKRTETLHKRFWLLTALKRWIENPRTDIPNPLDDLHAIVMRPYRANSLTNTLQSEVRVPALGISAILGGLTPKVMGDWRIGAALPVKIDEIKLGVRPRLQISIR
ncbi:RNB domain-containing protein [Favolaschia claudopus]|uniref:RNB domain-containing protein n=1 Tax=Favolaschia claudopus TaxID=2862362 RepID=A0AAW0C2Z0_9AGAR